MKLLASMAAVTYAQYGNYGDYYGYADGKGDSLNPIAGPPVLYPPVNGLFCWMCDSLTDHLGSAYFHCMMDGWDTNLANTAQHRVQACKGEERVCMWEERRRRGAVYSVCGGCKQPDACIHQWNQNWRWFIAKGAGFMDGTVDYVDGDCMGSTNGGTTITWPAGPALDGMREESVCRWCCKATNNADPVGGLCNAYTAGSPLHGAGCDAGPPTMTACTDTWFANFWSRDHFETALETLIGEQMKTVWSGVGRNPYSMEKTSEEGDPVSFEQQQFEVPGFDRTNGEDDRGINV